jgi:hypothetical protein
LYRQSDVDQVMRIKQLVFGEGLTLSGARRRLDDGPPVESVSDDEVAEVLEALASDARTRIAHVRDGLRSILKILSSAPGTVVVVDDFHLDPPPAKTEPEATTRSAAARRKPRIEARPGRSARLAGKPKRSRANA